MTILAESIAVAANSAIVHESRPVIVLIADTALPRECLAYMLRYSGLAGVVVTDADAPLPNDAPHLVIIDLSQVEFDAHAAAEVVMMARQRFGCAPLVLVADAARTLGSFLLDHKDHLAGVILTSFTVDIALAAIRLVLAGGHFIPSEAIHKPGAPVSSGETDHKRGAALTSRERQIIQLIKNGCPNKMIASTVRIAESTVKVHIRNAMRKCHVNNRTQLAIMHLN